MAAGLSIPGEMNVAVGSQGSRLAGGMGKRGLPVNARCRTTPARVSFAYPCHPVLGLALLAALGWASLAAAADQTVWPLTPYQVQVFVAVEPQPPLTPRLHAALMSTLSARIEAVLGAAWNADVTPPPPALGREMIRDLAGLQAKDIPLPPPQVDKILLVAVTTVPGGMTVTARDFDLRTRVLNTPVTRPVWQTGALEESTLGALLAAFAPVVRIERLEKDVAVLRPKAVGLPLGDRKLAIFREGDVLQPINRTNDRLSNFVRATVCPWSFCVVEKVLPEEARARCIPGCAPP